jgi:Tfp pilus assembly protein PilP
MTGRTVRGVREVLGVQLAYVMASAALIVTMAGARSEAGQAVPLQPGPAASAPKPPAPIAAAKDAAAKVAEGQQKNAEALDNKSALPPQQAAPSQPPAPPAPQPGAPAAGPSNQQPVPAPGDASAGSYTYDPNGRRDPFVSLLFRGGDLRPAGAVRPPGLPGQMVGELTVKGVLKNKGGFVAILQASDNKTYIGRPGDRVLDGSIKSIVQDAVVFSQDVNDPLSLVKQREVRKTIRPETK